jgi:hypothetical protein
MDTLVQVIERDPPAPRQLNRRVPRHLERICLRCLAKSPGDLYDSVAALGEELDRFLAGDPVETRSAGPLQGLARWETLGIFAWGAADVVVVTTILLIADGVASPLIVAYPLLIVASGLWLRTRLVTFTTVASVASYLVLVTDFYFRRVDLQVNFDLGVDRHVFLVLAMLLTGVVRQRIHWGMLGATDSMGHVPLPKPGDGGSRGNRTRVNV